MRSVDVTAYYSLVHLARLRAGQRALIHAAVGGVGRGAFTLAKRRLRARHPVRP